MRIISGKYAKRNLFTLKSMKTRPTSDKVKESLFNSLGQYFEGGACLDLYGGSGALGIEAVSRGMDFAWINDINRSAVEVIQKNVALTKETENFRISNLSANACLKKISAEAIKFDLVFLDPPYAKQTMAKDLAKLLSLDLLTTSAQVICETDEQIDLPDMSGFVLDKKHHLGRTLVYFYRRQA